MRRRRDTHAAHAAVGLPYHQRTPTLNVCGSESWFYRSSMLERVTDFGALLTKLLYCLSGVSCQHPFLD